MAHPLTVMVGICALLIVGGIALNVVDLDTGGVGGEFVWDASPVDGDGDFRSEWLAVNLVNGSRNLTRGEVRFGEVDGFGNRSTDVLVCGSLGVEDGRCVDPVSFPLRVGEGVGFGCERRGVATFFVEVVGVETFTFSMECQGVVR